MISEGQFATGFDELQLAFTQIPLKKFNWWYGKLQECDPQAFKLTIQRIIDGHDFFPKYKTWRVEYRIAKNELTQTTKIDYCGRCIEGYVILKIEQGNGEAAAPCKDCHPQSRSAINPSTYGLKWVQDPIEYNKQSKALPVAESKAKVVWLAGYIERLSTRKAKASDDQARAKLKGREGFGEETEYQSEKHRMAVT